jgi:hypothetical protein
VLLVIEWDYRRWYVELFISMITTRVHSLCKWCWYIFGGTSWDCTLGYLNFICDSDCLEAVDLIHNLTNASLHVCVYVLLEISKAVNHRTINIVHIPREQNICADFMVKEGIDSAYSFHWEYHPLAGLESHSKK